jgi:hypothetical protein
MEFPKTYSQITECLVDLCLFQATKQSRIYSDKQNIGFSVVSFFVIALEVDLLNSYVVIVFSLILFVGLLKRTCAAQLVFFWISGILHTPEQTP